MTAAILRLPVTDAALDRIVESDRRANVAEENEARAVAARSAIRSPSFYSDRELRAYCADLLAWGDGRSDYLAADAMIFALNKRERERAHAEARRAVETPAQVARRYLPELRSVVIGVSVAVLVALVGVWL